MADLSRINFKRTYELGESYEDIKNRARQELQKYWDYPNLLTFNDESRSLTFTSERLIPTDINKRPNVMLLFSNPHPHSVQQGMFLSRTTIGQENLFWPVMKASGWLSIPNEPENEDQRADRFIRAGHEGPFNLIFYCYYAFPTNYPEDIQKIFGKKYFTKKIETEAMDEFRDTVQDIDVEAVVIFNKKIFNRVSQDAVDRYIKRLNAGELIQSQVKNSNRPIPTFLTYPTGWRYHSDYMTLRTNNLEEIRKAIK